MTLNISIVTNTCLSIVSIAFHAPRYIFGGAAPTTYRSFQARGRMEAVSPAYTTATAKWDRSCVVTYTTGHGNARSLTH